MYFRYNGVWTGGHDVVGAAAPQTAWYFAEGTCRPGFDPYICVQNPGGGDAAVKITYMLGTGKTASESLTVKGSSRATVVVKHTLGEGDDAGHDFSAKVETTNGALVVEVHRALGDHQGAVGRLDLGGEVVPGVVPLAQRVLDHHGRARTALDGQRLAGGLAGPEHVGDLDGRVPAARVLDAYVGVEAGRRGRGRQDHLHAR